MPTTNPKNNPKNHTKAAAKARPKLSERSWLPWAILGGILVVSIFFRFWRLNTLPPGLHPDEAANGLDIVHRIFHGDLRILYDTNGPREALFFYLQAIFVALMGNTILALRIAPAIIGVGAVYATFLWGSDWFGRRVGLLAAAAASINVWAITVTRDSFRASMTPLMVALLMYFIGRAIKTRRMVYFVLSGLTLGLGVYTYTAFDTLAFGSLFLLGYLFVVRRDWLRQNAAKLGIATAIALVIMSPLLYLTVRHPNESTTARAGGTSFLNKGLNNGQPLQTLWTSAEKTFLQFNIKGDENPRQNTPGVPMLDTFVGLMFLLGFVLSLRHINRPKYFALLVVFGTMLLSAIVTAEGIPHGLRTLGSAPAAFILAGIGINFVLASWYKTFPINAPARSIGLYLIVLLFVLAAINSYKQYFVAWAQDPRTYAAYSEDAVRAGKYLLAHNAAGQLNYVYVGDYTDKPIDYLTYHKVSYTLIDTYADVSHLSTTPHEARLFIILEPSAPVRHAVVDTLEAKFPGGTLSEQTSAIDGHFLFFVYLTKS